MSEEHKSLLYGYIHENNDTDRLIGDILRAIYTNQSAFIAVTGVQGTGKTIFQYYLGDKLNLKMNPIYSVDQYKNILNNMPNREYIAILDGTLLFPSRNFASNLQKELQRQTNVLRAFTNVYSISFPFIEEADKTIRLHFETTELMKSGQDRIAKVTLDKKVYMIPIPEFPKERIDEIHEIDSEYKKQNL